MLYYLFQWLDKFDLPGAGVFNYITFRAGAAFIVALLMSTIVGNRFIMFMRRKKCADDERDLSIEGQMAKKGTPTMGGVIILVSILTGVLLFGILHNIYIILMLVTTVWLGTLGFLDDFIKVFKKDKHGLQGKFKIIGQVSIGLIVGLTLYFSPQVKMVETIGKDVNDCPDESTIKIYSENTVKSTMTTIPFVKNNNLDYADAFDWAGEHKQVLGWILFVIVVIFVVTAVSNGANLTDGLDGLATGSCAIQGATLGALAYLTGNVRYAGYLDIMYIPGAGELMVFASAMIGATIGFLWFNAYPAEIFMGDTGSLALGGMIAVMAIAIHKELLLPILSGIFLVESLSVIMQTCYFKCTHGGRIFKMTPLHHHFQHPAGKISALIQGPNIAHHEVKITVRFWIVGLILAALTIITLKMR